MSKWKCGICNTGFDNYQAQGFDGVIYCPLCYFKELYKREKQENQQLKKQKDDVVIKYIKHLIKRLEEFDIPKRKETGAFWYQVMGELEELLRMLGEIDD